MIVDGADNFPRYLVNGGYPYEPGKIVRAYDAERLRRSGERNKHLMDKWRSGVPARP